MSRITYIIRFISVFLLLKAMRMAHLARTRIPELERQIEAYKERKKKLFLHLEQVREKYTQKEISYESYQAEQRHILNGRTVAEWFDFYDSQIISCIQRLQEERKALRTASFLRILLFIFIGIGLIGVLFYSGPQLIGFIVQEETQSYVDVVQQTFTESQEYIWKPAHSGTLVSLLASGTIEGEGEVKVYLGDNLVFDSRISPFEEEQGSSFGITGRASENSNSEGQEVSDQSSEQPQQEAPQPEVSPSQQESPVGAPEQTTEESTEQPVPNEETTGEQTTRSVDEEEVGSEEVNETAPIEESTPSNSLNESEAVLNESEENKTDESPEVLDEREKEIGNDLNDINETEKQNRTETPVGRVRSFTRLCEETCDLEELVLDKEQYMLRVEIVDATLTLNNLEYELIAVEENVTELNESANPSAENVSIVREHGTIRLGQPVQWKVNVMLDAPVEASVSIPSEAREIVVKKVEREKEFEVEAVVSGITGNAVRESGRGFFGSF